MRGERRHMRLRRTLCILSLFCGAVPLQSQDEQNSMPAAVRRVIAELPSCSVLRQKLERGDIGNGNEERYMEPMKTDDVKRAIFLATAIWRNDQPHEIKVTQRLYFRKYDGPDAQITA